MKKSIGSTLSIFIAFVLVSSLLTINGSAYSQQNATTTQNQTLGSAPASNSTGTTGNTTTNTTAASSGDNATHSDEHNATEGNFVRDNAFVPLQDKTLPAGDYIHLYDITPAKIVSGHVAAKLPCNSDNESDVNVLIGQAPNLTAADMELVPELSNPGALCLYHVDLESNSTNPITDIAIQNSGDEDIDFTPTTTVVIGVNKIADLSSEEQKHEHSP
jgi:hypothetical protein